MLRSVKGLYRYAIRATDGALGSLADLRFDDGSWRVRYLVADTRRSFAGRKVLISPAARSVPDWPSREVPATLSQEQIRSGAPTQPVNRAYEERLYDYYGRPRE